MKEVFFPLMTEPFLHKYTIHDLFLLQKKRTIFTLKKKDGYSCTDYNVLGYKDDIQL